ncbi:hypothetical protein UlMin_013049 [Ulmus minor]
MEINQNECFPIKGTLSELLAAELESAGNCQLMKALYKALARNETEMIAKLVAPDLEWWFHGPPSCQHMMRMLTGESRPHMEFKFKPRRIAAIADRVIVEGWQRSRSYWVHVWTFKDGMITHLREYFDTWLTVIVREVEAGNDDGIIRLWQSDAKERLNRSLPDVVFAI